MQEFRRFGEYSNFKTEALNISLPPANLGVAGGKDLSYMGITIPSNLSDLYALNYVPLLARIRKDLNTWVSSSLPWFGRINLLKMDTLPKLLYPFQTVSVTVSKQFFSSLQSRSIRFVWHQGLSRIRHMLLAYPKLQGGVGLLDFELYHKVALLAQILEWFPRPFTKASTMVEQDLSTSDLRALLWGHSQELQRLSSSSPLHLWYKRWMSPLLSTDPSPLTSLFDNSRCRCGFSHGGSVCTFLLASGWVFRTPQLRWA